LDRCSGVAWSRRGNQATFCIREADGRIGIHAEPEIEMRRTKDLRADLVANTQRITDVVEAMVQRHPEQWFWLMPLGIKKLPDGLGRGRDAGFPAPPAQTLTLSSRCSAISSVLWSCPTSHARSSLAKSIK
jgi:hypothetical protein